MNLYAITTYHNRETRWKNLKWQIERIRNTILFFQELKTIIATDWKMYRHTNLSPQQYKQQSLTLAYYQACQMAVYDDLYQFVIIEDDIQISDILLFNDLVDDHFEFDLCYLSLTKHNKESAIVEPYNNLWNKIVANYWETPATLWTIEMAKKFIHHIEKKLETGLWLGHIDHELMKMHTELKLNYYCPVEQCCYGLSSEPEKAKGVIDLTGSISEKG